jgi:hypothetical protein
VEVVNLDPVPGQGVCILAGPGCAKTYTIVQRWRRLDREARSTLFLTSVNATKHRLLEAMGPDAPRVQPCVKTFGSVAMALCGRPTDGSGMSHEDLQQQVTDLQALLAQVVVPGLVTAHAWTSTWSVPAFAKAVVQRMKKWYRQYTLLVPDAMKFRAEHEPLQVPNMLPDLRALTWSFLARAWARSRAVVKDRTGWAEYAATVLGPLREAGWLFHDAKPDTHPVADSAEAGMKGEDEGHMVDVDDGDGPAMDPDPTDDQTSPELLVTYATWWVLVTCSEDLVHAGEDVCQWSELRLALGVSGVLDVSARVADPRTLCEVSVDEASDLSMVHTACAIRIAQVTKSHLVLVGDPRQHIYGFSGAQDVLSLGPKVLGMPIRYMPLRTCFRLPRRVLAFAQGFHVGSDALVCPPGVPEGHVVVKWQSSAQAAYLAMEQARDPRVSPALAKSVALVFRSNRALGEALLAMARPRRTVFVEDRFRKDLVKAWSSVVAAAAAATTTTCPEGGDDGIGGAGGDDDRDGPKTRTQVLTEVIQAEPGGWGATPGAHQASSPLAWMQALSSASPRTALPHVIMVTVHGSKGSEYDTVFVDGAVLKWTGRRGDCMDHLEFVGITRAKVCLVLAPHVGPEFVDAGVRRLLHDVADEWADGPPTAE